VILEKLLRGDVVLEWQNPKAVVPVSKGCVLRDLSGRRGSFLINNYKQHGGFLGVGRGYYARRNKPEEESNSESEQTDNRIPFTKSTSLIQDSSQLGENGNQTQEHAGKITHHCKTSFPENKDEARIFQSLINSHSTISINNIRRKDSGEPVQKDASQAQMCKQMCEEMCYRIVKEHPFIAPFIRRDLLQGMQRSVAAAAKGSTSGSASSVTDVPHTWTKMYESLCLPPDDETTTKARITPKMKKRARSVSRSTPSKMRNTSIQPEKWDSLTQKSGVSGASRKFDLALSKKTAEIKPELQPPNNIPSTAPKTKLLKSARSRRSFSLCRKTPMNDSDPFSQVSKLAQDANVIPEEAVANINEDKFADCAEKGSSVDPMKVSPTKFKDHLKSTPIFNEQPNQSEDGKLAESTEGETAQCTRKPSAHSLSGMGNRNGKEGRINEIVSALTSWGYSIRNKVQGKDNGPSQMCSANGETRSGCSKLRVNEDEDTAKLNSKALIDLIKNLAESRKNRKLMRQISSVLSTNKTPGRTSRNSKSFSQSQTSPSIAAMETPVTVKSPGNIQDCKDKKNIQVASDTGTKVPQDIKNGPVVKRRRIVRERSYFAKLASTDNKESSNENFVYQPSAVPSMHSRKFSPPKTENEIKEKLRRNTTPQKRHRKSPKNSSLKRSDIKKIEPRVVRKTVSTRKLDIQFHREIQTEEDDLEAVECTPCKKYSNEGYENSQRRQLESQSNSDVKNKRSSEVENTNHVANINHVEKAIQVEEVKPISENINESVENDYSGVVTYQNNDNEKGIQTADLRITNEVVSCQFSQSVIKDNQFSQFVVKDNRFSQSVIKDNQFSQSVFTDNQFSQVMVKENQFPQSMIKDKAEAAGNDEARAQVPNENPAKKEDTFLKTIDVPLSSAKEAEIDIPETCTKERKGENQTITTKTKSKHSTSNKVRKSQTSGDFFSEIHTLKPTQRKTSVTSSKSAGAVRSNTLSKQPSSGNKSGNRKLPNKVQKPERQPVSVSTKLKEQTRAVVKRGQKNNIESTQPVTNKARENSRATSKGNKQTSSEIRSRYEQYQKNKLQKNTPIRNRKLPVNKEVPVELNHNINQASLQHTEPETDKILDTVGQVHTTYISSLFPSAYTTRNKLSN
ncbi:unnamed protein product, partial [Candidula unifasciata]